MMTSKQNKIAVFGARGQLGSAIYKCSGLYSDKYEYLFLDKSQVDITDIDSLKGFFEQYRPQYIINCAAYTAVDDAETNQKSADLLNHQALYHIATLSDQYACRVIHISTDFVFDGRKGRPYTENDDASPIQVYGASKLAGEKALMDVSKNAVIFRTSWLYGGEGKNFFNTICRLAASRNTISVVYDQLGTPTLVADLAEAIINVLPKLENDTPQIFHFSNEGVTSWYDFAVEIVSAKGYECEVLPILSHEYKTPAMRPAYSVLDKSKIKQCFNMQIPYWRDSLIKHTGVVM